MSEFNIIYSKKNVDSRFHTDITSADYIKTNYSVYNQDLTDIDELWLKENENYFIIVRYHCGLESVLTNEKNIPIDKRFYDLVLNRQNVFLILINDTEADSVELVQKLKDYLIVHSIPENKVILITNNLYLNEWKKKANSNINVKSTKRLDKWITSCMIKHEPKLLLKKPKFFTFHNRSLKPHRYFLLLNLLKQDGLINDSDWSFLRGYEIEKYYKFGDNSLPELFLRDLFNREELVNFRSEMNYVDNLKIKTSEYELGFNFDVVPTNYDLIFSNNAYKNAYVNIATESQFSHLDVHITEKSLLPFYFFQIPLIMASPTHIASLKKRYGFDFFEDIIDLSYDQELNHRKRFDMYLEQIANIYKRKKEVIKIYKNSKDRLMENQKKVISIMNNDEDEKFFQNLINLKTRLI